VEPSALGAIDLGETTMLEEYAFFVLIAGLLIAAVGCLWLVIAAFKVRKLWGFGVLFFPPLVLVFIYAHFRKSLPALIVLVISGLFLGAPYAANFYSERHAHRDPREKIVDGEMHLTLTNWDGADYSFLEKKPQTVVVQMANPDVTDDTLKYLRGMDHLRELDLNDTNVTDEGLVVLAELPQLQILRLARTKITDAGFRKHLSDKRSLVNLDLTGTAVKGKSKRDWRTGLVGRQYLE
jgi:hypothetical protein